MRSLIQEILFLCILIAIPAAISYGDSSQRIALRQRCETGVSRTTAFPVTCSPRLEPYVGLSEESNSINGKKHGIVTARYVVGTMAVTALGVAVVYNSKYSEAFDEYVDLSNHVIWGRPGDRERALEKAHECSSLLSTRNGFLYVAAGLGILEIILLCTRTGESTGYSVNSPGLAFLRLVSLRSNYQAAGVEATLRF
jgi:hypothetical protein